MELFTNSLCVIRVWEILCYLRFSAALTTDFHNRAELISRCINLSFSKKFCQADNAIDIFNRTTGHQ
ncbi:hypothetical protein SADUNF_Sadunf05G0130800 [Salix dunnii]|uniref:Uncharacterized protein n=1 Tax=Salix dunnii TaxID=1413687 RepID=A0A835KCU4_9ROSI|nr:hypothetical protein SADUNF_Sadunf05G0130800 [Salix dunnii]